MPSTRQPENPLPPFPGDAPSPIDVLLTHNARDLARGELSFPGLHILRPEQFLVEVERWLR